MEAIALSCARFFVEPVLKEYFEDIWEFTSVSIGASPISAEYPLHAAVKEGNKWKVRKILKKVPVDSLNSMGYTALYEATIRHFTKKNRKIIEILLKAGAAPADLLYPYYSPAQEVFQQNDVPLMNTFLKYMKDVNLPIYLGVTAVDVAIGNNNLKMIEILFEMGADVNRKTFAEGSYLHLAVHRNNQRLVELLLNAGIDINAKDYRMEQTALHYAADGYAKDCLEILLKKNPDINIKDKNGNTPLNIAVIREICNEDNIELLLKHGADPNIPDHKGYTPLHNLARSFDREPYKNLFLLLDHKANVNFRSKNLKTPLHIAVKYDHAKLCAILIDRGADINMKNSLQKTVLEMNIQFSRSVRFIVQYVAITKHIRNKEMDASIKRRLLVSELLVKHLESCEDELKLLKRRIGNSSVCIGEFYWYTRQAVESLRNQEFCDYLSNVSSKFPIYGRRIQENFILALERRRLEDLAEEFLMKVFPRLPFLCISHIISFLSDKDLKVMVCVVDR